MCGITAYKGKRKASHILTEALHTLEYRGYDSAGIATLDSGKIVFRKGVGKVAAVAREKNFYDLQGNVGIAHTRWATTGGVTDENAHPHVSGRYAIVHNGVVENYSKIKSELVGKGHDFKSETDTEVILELFIEFCKTNKPLDAVKKVAQSVHGRNTFVIMDSESEAFLAYKNGSPLVIGFTDDIFLSSDVTPIIPYTKTVSFVDDDRIVHVDSKVSLFDKELNPIHIEKQEISWSVEQAQKGDYSHFMIKEIFEQKETIDHAIAQDKEKILQISEKINEAFGTYAVGCGTAGKVALASTYIFSDIAKKHVNFSIGSEFPSYHDFLKPESLLLAVSQSGETADTLEAIDAIRSVNGKVISIVNVMGSSIMRKSDECVMVHAGPERSVCSTKATTGQLAIMYLLAFAVAGKYDEGITLLKKTASEVKKLLTQEYSDSLKELAEKLKNEESMYVLGRGQNYPVAMEAAIKIQEVSYLHAEGFAGGELKHGPIALIEKGTVVIVFVANDDTKEDILTNAIEVKSRGGFIIGIGPEKEDVFDEWITVPDLPDTSPIVNIIPIQLLAYHISVARGNDVDQPRNLAKSVTVK